MTSYSTLTTKPPLFPVASTQTNNPQGFGLAHSSLSPQEATTYAALASAAPAIGLESSEDILRWIWETGFSAVAGDQPGFEALPFQNKEWWLHEWLLAGWGLPIGELFDLERLAAECGRLKKWSFFFSSMPLKVSFSFEFLALEDDYVMLMGSRLLVV